MTSFGRGHLFAVLTRVGCSRISFSGLIFSLVEKMLFSQHNCFIIPRLVMQPSSYFSPCSPMLIQITCHCARVSPSFSTGAYLLSKKRKRKKRLLLLNLLSIKGNIFGSTCIAMRTSGQQRQLWFLDPKWQTHCSPDFLTYFHFLLSV